MEKLGIAQWRRLQCVSDCSLELWSLADFFGPRITTETEIKEQY